MPKVVTKEVKTFERHVVLSAEFLSPRFDGPGSKLLVLLSHLFAFWRIAMSPSANYLALESEYLVDRFSHEKMPTPQHRSTRQSRPSAKPKSFNGIHRRRAKRVTW